MKNANTLKIWAGLLPGVITPQEGHDFVVRDGYG
jgi:hypothetical protein